MSPDLCPPRTQHFNWKSVGGFLFAEQKNSLDTTTGIKKIELFLSPLYCLIRKDLIKQQNNHHEINNQKHSCHTRANHYSEAAVADSASAVNGPREKLKCDGSSRAAV